VVCVRLGTDGGKRQNNQSMTISRCGQRMTLTSSLT
jgi:hypothetical protein